jgi:hypothetical protein
MSNPLLRLVRAEFDLACQMSPTLRIRAGKSPIRVHEGRRMIWLASRRELEESYAFIWNLEQMQREMSLHVHELQEVVESTTNEIREYSRILDLRFPQGET